jgi:hypothetical protein
MNPLVLWYSLLLAHLLGQLPPANDNGTPIEQDAAPPRRDCPALVSAHRPFPGTRP